MGNCLDCFGKQQKNEKAYSSSISLSPVSSTPPKTTSKLPGKAKQEQNWKATGIIGLRDQNLRDVPGSVATVGEAARVLDASNNKIKQLPEFLFQLTSLQRLVFASNSLYSLPPEVGVLLQLKVLVLDLNQLQELPEALGQLTKVEKLSLYSNKLERLPRSIGNMASLQVLNVSHNQLVELPETLGGCTALEEVDASNNTIFSIPATLSNLKKLKTLNLDNNKVTQVPTEVFTGCLSLQTLSLHGNPISPDVVQDTPGFMDFEQRRRTKYDKAIAGGVMLGSKGLDEGLDRKV